MISYSEAIKIILKQKALGTHTLPIGRALGMVSAADVISNEVVPPFHNSAMDGFAVKASDVANVPVKLNVEGSTAAGDTPNKGQGGAWEIMTGAPVPQGYDAVVLIEDVDILSCNAAGRPKEIVVKAPADITQNIRDAGEDFNIGDVVLNTGDIINPEHIMALATLGIGEVSVYPKPSVAVISTGKELVDDLSKQLEPGQIRNSNAPYLLATLAASGVSANYVGTIHDEVDVFEATIAKLLDGDVNIIISTGAVSMGRYDFVPDSLRKLGAEILFHKVAIRPGKPILFAKFPNGIFYFGLPGNPISAAVGLRFFVQPLLRKLQGLKEEYPVFAKISASTNKKMGFRFFRKAYAYPDVDGQLHVDILDGQESFKIHPMLKANCWAVLPEEASGFMSVEVVEIYPLTLNTFFTTSAQTKEKSQNKIYRAV